MCCYPDAKTKREFLKQLRKCRRMTFWAWKVLERSGEAPIRSYKYRPGVNATKTAKRYNSSWPSGLHVFLKKPRRYVERGEKLVRVRCHREDLICMEKPVYNLAHAVVRKLTIFKADWLAAGLPKEAVKR